MAVFLTLVLYCCYTWHIYFYIFYMTTLEFLRSFRIFEYAIFDFALSFLGIFLLSPFLSKLFLKMNIIVPKKNWIILTIPLSILIHIIFLNFTPLTKNFLDYQNHFLLKGLVLACLFLGLRGIKMQKQKAPRKSPPSNE